MQADSCARSTRSSPAPSPFLFDRQPLTSTAPRFDSLPLASCLKSLLRNACVCCSPLRAREVLLPVKVQRGRALWREKSIPRDSRCCSNFARRCHHVIAILCSCLMLMNVVNLRTSLILPGNRGLEDGQIEILSKREALKMKLRHTYTREREENEVKK